MDLSPEVLAALIAVAAAAGFVDAIAGGGGLLTLPALLAAGAPPVSALGVNKLQSVFGTATACFTYARGGHVDFPMMAAPAFAAFAGSAAGAFLVQGLDTGFLAGLVPLLLIAIAAYFLFSPAMSEVEARSTATVAFSPWPTAWWRWPSAFMTASSARAPAPSMPSA
jgi:uncharacterized protein